MSIYITSPVSDADHPEPVHVQPGGTTGYICAWGNLKIGPKTNAKVYAKVYAAGDTPPDNPPPGATSVDPQGNNWKFFMIPNVKASTAASYPANKLKIWATYEGVNTPDSKEVTFYGKTADKTRCEGPGTT